MKHLYIEVGGLKKLIYLGGYEDDETIANAIDDIFKISKKFDAWCVSQNKLKDETVLKLEKLSIGLYNTI